MASYFPVRAFVAALTSLLLALGLGALPAEAAPHKKRTKAQIAWTADTWVSGSGAGYALTGTLNGKKRRAVQLQYKTASGWRTLSRTRSQDHAFALSGTWDWYGVHKVRVRVPATGQHRAASFGHAVTVQSGYAARGLADDYKLTRYKQRRLRMDPCQTVNYRINTAQIGPAVDPLVHSAVALFSRATGIEFKFVGTSDKIALLAGRLEKRTDLLIGWANEGQLPSLKGTVARGGPLRVVPGRDRNGRLWKVTQAGVTVNWNTTTAGPGQAVDLTMDSQSRATLGMTLLHEMGHAFGLAHASKGEEGRQQLMYWSIDMLPWSDGWFRSLFGAGDLTGLNKVGLAAGCVR